MKNKEVLRNTIDIVYREIVFTNCKKNNKISTQIMCNWNNNLYKKY